MEFELNNAIAILERTPSVLITYLKDLPEGWTHMNEGGDTWSPYDVIGHLIHGENTDWIPRARIILNDGPKAFTPFDRFAQFENSKEKTLIQLLEEFELLRKENLEVLKSMDLSEEKMQLTGIHPEFGEITLKQLLSAWVVHDLGHIMQISRVMAKQYKTESGPWTKYMRVLNE